jgi:hypothetical protein
VGYIFTDGAVGIIAIETVTDFAIELLEKLYQINRGSSKTMMASIRLPLTVYYWS